MKKNRFLFLLFPLLFAQCDLEILNSRQDRNFIFENYTNLDYQNTVISVGEVRDNIVIIRYSDTLPLLPARANSSFSNTETGPSKVWDDYFIDFIQTYEDKGCFLIEFEDDQKLFIPVSYDDFPGSQISAPNRMIVEILESGVRTLAARNEIHGIPIEDIEIIR